jgi:hypothetical protein
MPGRISASGSVRDFYVERGDGSVPVVHLGGTRWHLLDELVLFKYDLRFALYDDTAGRTDPALIVHKNGKLHDCRLENLEWVPTGRAYEIINGYTRRAPR